MRASLRVSFLACLLMGSAHAEVEVPPLKARVTDLTNTLDDWQLDALEQRLAAFEAAKGSQIAVLIVPTTQPEAIEQYSICVAEQWRLGRKGVDDGALLLVAKNDRKVRLEVGRGLEGAVPDAVAKRIIKHLIAPRWVVDRKFPSATLRAIANAIQESEQSHDGELRFAVEGGLKLWLLLNGRTPRARAIEIFSQLRVWDTEHNSGVLIYVQVADRRIEIVADRGINAKVEQQQWDAISRAMKSAFQAQRHEAGALEGIREITALLAQHFPPTGANPDELPNAPVML